MRIVVGVDCLIRAFEGWGVFEAVTASSVRFPYGSFAAPMVATFVVPYIAAWMTAAIAFVAGWQSRLAGIVLSSALLYGLFVDQQTYSNHQLLLGIIVTLLVFANCGGAFSVDARHKRAETGPVWAVFLLKLQLSLVYLFSALAKLNATYISGVVIFASLRDSGLLALPSVLQTPAILAAMAAATIAMELFLAVAFWSPAWRGTAAVAGLAFHAGLVTLMLPSQAVLLLVFGIAMASLYLAFFEHEPRPLTVYYDDRCGICSTAIGRIVRAGGTAGLNAVGTSRPEVAEAIAGMPVRQTLVVVDAGRMLTMSRAFAAIFRSLPLRYQPLRIIGLPLISAISDVVYRQVARHRHRLSGIVGAETCGLDR